MQLTYKTPISHQDLRQQDLEYRKLVSDRVRLIISSNSGLVNLSMGSLTRVTNFEYIVSSLVGVSPMGNIIEVDQTTIKIPANLAGKLVYVYAEIKQIPSTTKRMYEGELYSVYVEHRAVVSVGEYLPSDAIYLAEVIASFEDYSVSYSGKKQFTAYDAEHRESKGTGNPSVPHSLGINDLSTSGMTLYSMMLNRGIIISKDSSTKGISGKLCVVKINKQDIQYDSSGIVTKRSKYGKVNAPYVVLPVFPNAVGTVKDSNRELATDHIKGTNILVLSKDTGSNYSFTNLSIDCYQTDTLMISEAPLPRQLVSFNTGNDLVISEGVDVILNDLTVAFNGYGDIPKQVEIKLNKDGEAVRYSDILIPYSDYDINSYINKAINPSKIRIGATKIKSSDLNFLLKYKIIGKYNEVAIEEEIFFDSSYSDTEPNSNPLEENVNQFILTKSKFTYIERIQVTEQVSVSTTTGKIVVYLEQDYASDTRLSLASVFWNGREVSSVEDTRHIDYVVRNETPLTIHSLGDSIASTLNVDTDKVVHLFSDDFHSPTKLNTATVDWNGFNYPILSSNSLSDRVRDCYRSTMQSIIPWRNSLTRIAVCLHEDEFNSYGCVRVKAYTTVYSEFKGEEFILKPLGGGMYVGYLDGYYDFIQVVATGKARGLSCFYLKQVSDVTAHIIGNL